MSRDRFDVLERFQPLFEAPEPSFEMYRMDALFAGMRYAGVSLRADFALDVDAMEAAIVRELDRIASESANVPLRGVNEALLAGTL